MIVRVLCISLQRLVPLQLCGFLLKLIMILISVFAKSPSNYNHPRFTAIVGAICRLIKRTQVICEISPPDTISLNKSPNSCGLAPQFNHSNFQCSTNCTHVPTDNNNIILQCENCPPERKTMRREDRPDVERMFAPMSHVLWINNGVEFALR